MLVQWTNELQRWNQSYYGNLNVINLPVDKIWRPDLSIINGYNELNPVGLKFVKMKMYHNGLTIWTPGQKAEFLCEINVSKFPFDTQDCYMDFFNWGDTENETTLSYLSSDDNSRRQAVHPNSEWTIQEIKIEKQGTTVVRVRLILKRKPISMVLTVLLPVFLLSFLNIFVFLVPTDSGEKLSFAVTVLLSQAVFLSFISSLMPQTSESISGLSIYISCQLILSTFYVLLTCCILTVYHRNTTKNPLPAWFVKILCIIPQVNEHDDKKLAFDNYAPSGVELSQKFDRACFWIFLFVVVFMTSYFTGYGLMS